MKNTNKNWFARHKVLTVILVLVVLGIIGTAAGGGNKSGNNTNTNANNTPNTAKQKPVEVKVGQPAHDGKFEFTVQSIQCNKPNVGSDFLTKTAQGQYCLLKVTVKNIGDEKQSLFSSNQKLLDASNKEYSADDTATIYAAPQGSTWFSDINPGNIVEGVMVFDLPKGITPTTAVLHDSAFSGGVKVNLQ